MHEAKSCPGPSGRLILTSFWSKLGSVHTPTAVVFEKTSIWQRGIGAFIISLGPQQLKDNGKKKKNCSWFPHTFHKHKIWGSEMRNSNLSRVTWLVSERTSFDILSDSKACVWTTGLYLHSKEMNSLRENVKKIEQKTEGYVVSHTYSVVLFTLACSIG